MTVLDGVYCGPAPAPADLLASWNLDPFALAVTALVLLTHLRNRAGLGAGIVIAVALISPLCALSSALFSARVVHDVLLVAVAAPLLAVARPGRANSGVAVPFLLATAAFWGWHLPVAYDAALGNKLVYWVMQASLFGTAFAFWRAAFSQPAGVGAAWVFPAYLTMGMLGALLSLAPVPLYATHAVGPLLWGMSPLADQQLGGLIMWFPAALPFVLWGGLMARRAWTAMGEAG